MSAGLLQPPPADGRSTKSQPLTLRVGFERPIEVSYLVIGKSRALGCQSWPEPSNVVREHNSFKGSDGAHARMPGPASNAGIYLLCICQKSRRGCWVSLSRTLSFTLARLYAERGGGEIARTPLPMRISSASCCFESRSGSARESPR